MRYTVDVENNREVWYKENTKEYHRENGPAYILYYENGAKQFENYHLNNKLHNENGPASIHYDMDGNLTYQQWSTKRKFHNENGPARIWYNKDGSIKDRQWWIDDKQLTEEEFNNRKKSCGGKVVEIEGKKYKLVEV